MCDRSNMAIMRIGSGGEAMTGGEWLRDAVEEALERGLLFDCEAKGYSTTEALEAVRAVAGDWLELERLRSRAPVSRVERELVLAREALGRADRMLQGLRRDFAEFKQEIGAGRIPESALRKFAGKS